MKKITDQDILEEYLILNYAIDMARGDERYKEGLRDVVVVSYNFRVYILKRRVDILIDNIKKIFKTRR